MDLIWLNIDMEERRIALCLRDATGDAVHEIAGPAFDRLAPLFREGARVAAREARPRRADLADTSSEKAIWEHKYHVGSDGWELMRPAPPLARWLKDHPLPPGTRALVPGCGRGHEARLLARCGARVVAVDFAETAIAEAKQLADGEAVEPIEFVQADLFALPAAYQGAFDLVVEHCCFCSVDPGRRDDYVQAMAGVLRDGGQFVGLFWCHDSPGGPPHGSSAAEVEGRLAARFTILHREVPADSILTRAGQEVLLHAVSRG